MTQIQRRVRSQVCLDADTPPITYGDATTVKYYSDTDGDPYFAPQWHWLWYDSAWKGGRGAIRESVYTASPGPPFTFTGAPVNRVLAEDVTLQPGVPFLNYYAWDAPTTAVTPVPLSTIVDDDVLPANSMAKVVRIDVSFRLLPGRPSSATGGPIGNQLDATRDADFATSAYVRNSDYTDSAAANRVWGARCS